MNPTYTLVIRVTIAAHKTSRDRQVEFKRYIDFAPVEGMKIKFTNDDGAELDITLINLHYDYSNKQFVEEQVDEALLEEIREPDRPECTISPTRMQEYMDYYKSFEGWNE